MRAQQVQKVKMKAEELEQWRTQIEPAEPPSPPPDAPGGGETGNMALLGQGFEGGVMAAVRAAKNAVDALGATGRGKTTE